mmetsp:Transcript_36982/g.117705  ORF Transcript_36982/g.117705 Transcript_36982/m.117705 type:complete len:201 (-) Transcript_36982:121-723(-)
MARRWICASQPQPRPETSVVYRRVFPSSFRAAYSPRLYSPAVQFSARYARLCSRGMTAQACGGTSTLLARSPGAVHSAVTTESRPWPVTLSCPGQVPFLKTGCIVGTGRVPVSLSLSSISASTPCFPTFREGRPDTMPGRLTRSGSSPSSRLFSRQAPVSPSKPFFRPQDQTSQRGLASHSAQQSSWVSMPALAERITLV